LSATSGNTYKYLDEVNESIVRNFPHVSSSPRPVVLDVGCGTASTGKALEKKGYEVWGIDNSHEACMLASKHITKALPADITDFRAIDENFKNKVFDHIIFADILEHVADPWGVLKHYYRYLKPDGRLIVSLPNTAAWTKRFRFLFGSFDYEDTGIMDRDHIRFFTMKSAKEMIKDAGFTIIKIDYIPYFIRIFQPAIKKIFLKNMTIDSTNRNILSDSPFYGFYMKFVYPVEYWLGYPFKSFFAFKMVLIAKKLHV